MNKPQSLRRALSDAIPWVRDNPQQLRLSMENGAVVASRAGSAWWEYRYALKVTLAGYSDDPDRIMAAVLHWLSDSQPDAMDNPSLRDKIFIFAIDALDGAASDIRITLQLTERMQADAGTSDVIALPEPPLPDAAWTVKKR